MTMTFPHELPKALPKKLPKTLIVHGLDGSPAPHWQQWWAATDPNAILVDLPQPHAPNRVQWHIELAGMILRHPNCLLVGHSLGAVLIAQVLANWPQLAVKGALLVAPADQDISPRIAGFGTIPNQTLDLPVTLVASRNDPWMSFARAETVAAQLGADLVDAGLAGHINVASGYGPWPLGKALRDALHSGNPIFDTPIQEQRIAL
jgi:hypothetical protein